MTEAEKLLRLKSDFDECYAKGYSDGLAASSSSEISNFANYYVTASDGGCDIMFINTHASMFLHLSFLVEDYKNSEDYSDTIIIPPNSEYLWSSTEDNLGMTNSSSDWFVEITEMRFSADGV